MHSASYVNVFPIENSYFDRGFSPFPAGPKFGPIPNRKKYSFFPNRRFFSHFHNNKKTLATNILFHPFIPIHQINSPRTLYIY